VRNSFTGIGKYGIKCYDQFWIIVLNPFKISEFAFYRIFLKLKSYFQLYSIKVYFEIIITILQVRISRFNDLFRFVFGKKNVLCAYVYNIKVLNGG